MSTRMTLTAARLVLLLLLLLHLADRQTRAFQTPGTVVPAPKTSVPFLPRRIVTGTQRRSGGTTHSITRPHRSYMNGSKSRSSSSPATLYVSFQPQWNPIEEEGGRGSSSSSRKKNSVVSEPSDKKKELQEQTTLNTNNQIASFVGAIAVLTFVILFHELGHFLAAQSFGLQPHEFNIGFGPKLASFVGVETSYNLRALPLGGYVALDRSKMSMLPFWAQVEILSAGVFFNLVLSWFIYTLQIWKGQQGIPVPVFDSGIVVGGLVEPVKANRRNPSSPVPAKGLLKPGDVIIGVNGKSIQEEPTSSEMEVQRAIDLLLQEVQSTPSGEPVIFTVVDSKDSQKLNNVHVVPISTSSTATTTKPSVGVYLLPNFVGMDTLKTESPLDASALAASHVSTITKETMIGILTFVKEKIAGIGRKSSNEDDASIPPKYEVAGPVRVVERATNVVASHDLATVLNYVAAASINLGMFNVIPIPPTDGFQIIMTAILQAGLLAAARAGATTPHA